MATITPPLPLPRKWYFLTYNMRPVCFPQPSLRLTPDCNICQTRFLRSPDPEPPVRLRCGHVFGEFCLREWFKEQDTCPMCWERMFKAAPAASLRPAVSLVDGARLATKEITEEEMAFYRRMRRGGLAVMRARVAESEDKDDSDAAA